MTSTVINAPVGQELQLSDLQNINGGGASLVVGGVLIGAGTALIADMLLEKSTGKGIGEHWIDACERLSNGRLQKMRAMSLFTSP